MAWVVGTVFYVWMFWCFIKKGYVQVCFMFCFLRPYICKKLDNKIRQSTRGCPWVSFSECGPLSFTPEFEQASGVGDGQGSLACCSPWCRKELDATEWLNWSTTLVTHAKSVVITSCWILKLFCDFSFSPLVGGLLIDNLFKGQLLISLIFSDFLFQCH